MRFSFIVLIFYVNCNFTYGIVHNDRTVFEAANAGNESIVETPIEKGANVNTTDQTELISDQQNEWKLIESKKTPFHTAVERDYNSSVQNVDWSTPLHFAAIRGNEKIVKLLIRNGADTEAKSYQGLEWTPLHYAASNGHTKAVAALIQNAANINALDFNNQTALHAAITKNGEEEIAELLIQRGIDVNLGAPIISAVERGKQKIVELLMQNGADVNVRDNSSRTLLHLAAINGHENIVELLFRNGSDVNAKDGENFTPIYYAVINGHEKIVKFLIDNGADASIRGSKNRTLLHLAAFNGREKVVDVLIQMGANVSARDDGYLTPLHLAALKDQEMAADVLIQNGADVNATDLDNISPLHLAAGKDQMKTAELLIQKGANINARNKHDNTPLHLAALKGQETTTELLIRNGANINSKNEDNNAPLHLAAENGIYGIVSLLLERKPNIKIKNNDGKTAIDIANSKEFYRIADAIEGVGSISKRACRIYSNHLTEEILDEDDETKIVFPWMAALGYTNEQYNTSFECAGTIISDEFILTAAHCVEPRPPSVVRLGKLSLVDETITENRQYKEIIPHPNYLASEMKNDIALIRLTERVWLSKFIMPACLQINLRDESPNVRLAVTGWGIGSPVWPKSYVLRTIEMVTMPLSKCNRSILMNNRPDRNLSALGNGIAQSYYCAYDPESNVGSCDSDGGPLQMIPNDMELAKVIGIGSFGITCDERLPSIYTRIAHYIGWIESKVWPTGEITVLIEDGD